MKNVLILSFGMFLTTLNSTHAGASEPLFNGAEEEKIISIVKQYLLDNPELIDQMNELADKKA